MSLPSHTMMPLSHSRRHPDPNLRPSMAEVHGLLAGLLEEQRARDQQQQQAKKDSRQLPQLPALATQPVQQQPLAQQQQPVVQQKAAQQQPVQQQQQGTLVVSPVSAASGASSPKATAMASLSHPLSSANKANKAGQAAVLQSESVASSKAGANGTELGTKQPAASNPVQQVHSVVAESGARPVQQQKRAQKGGLFACFGCGAADE